MEAAQSWDRVAEVAGPPLTGRGHGQGCQGRQRRLPDQMSLPQAPHPPPCFTLLATTADAVTVFSRTTGRPRPDLCSLRGPPQDAQRSVHRAQNGPSPSLTARAPLTCEPLVLPPEHLPHPILHRPGCEEGRSHRRSGTVSMRLRGLHRGPGEGLPAHPGGRAPHSHPAFQEQLLEMRPQERKERSRPRSPDPEQPTVGAPGGAGQ